MLEKRRKGNKTIHYVLLLFDTFANWIKYNIYFLLFLHTTDYGSNTLLTKLRREFKLKTLARSQQGVILLSNLSTEKRLFLRIIIDKSFKLLGPRRS